MSKYYYNKDYFAKIDSCQKAYWLGFISADGYINRNYKNEKLKSMSLELGLCDKDVGHIIKFRDCIETNVPIKKRDILFNGNTYPSDRIVICCTKMCYDLTNLGCTPNKSFTLRFPTKDQVPETFQRDWLRGYFDGNGFIHFKDERNKSLIVSGVSGTETILRDIINNLMQNEAVNKTPRLTKDKRSNSCSFFIYGKDNNYDFLSYLYSGSDMYLDRKHDSYLEFVSAFDKDDHYGVYRAKSGSYVATISINSKKITLGTFANVEDAINARKEAEKEKDRIMNSQLNQ